MSNAFVETMVGLFMITGIACLWFLAVSLGGMTPFGTEGYDLHAKFTNASGLDEGADVEIAGVDIGIVKSINLDGVYAKVTLSISPHVKIEEDAVASIRNRGLLGGKFIRILPGGSDDYLSSGDEIEETEPVVDIEELIGKFIYNQNNK